MLDGKFIRGTTPIHRFALPFITSQLSDLTITYGQLGEVIVKKTMEDCDVAENLVTVSLTQQESLSFSPNEIAEVQMKVATIDGDVLASPRYRLAVEDVLDDKEFDV